MPPRVIALGELLVEVLNHTGGAGSGYDQVDVDSGSVTLGGASTLTVDYTGGAGAFTPFPAQVFTIIDNDGSNPAVQGTGIGLFVCKLLIEHMGGRLTLRSEVGVGSTFRISLPLAD